jgi:hypothetical protein
MKAPSWSTLSPNGERAMTGLEIVAAKGERARTGFETLSLRGRGQQSSL